MSIVVPLAQRIAQMEAIAKYNAAQAEELAAKADYVAMMTDVDLSPITDNESEGMTDAQ